MNQVKGNGASDTLFQHDRPNKVQVSRFDLSRKVNFSLDTGMIVPIDLIEVLPNDKFDISAKMALDTLPLVATSLTNYKITTHWYYMRKRDMWKGWKTFITKGRSGNVKLTVPKIAPHGRVNVSDSQQYPISINGTSKVCTASIYADGHHSLASFLGVPPYRSGIYSVTSDSSSSYNFALQKDYLPYSVVLDSSVTTVDPVEYNNNALTGLNTLDYVSALPFVMYQSICKNNYCNQNLLQDNTALFPLEGDDDWLLPYSCGTKEGDVVGVANYIDGDTYAASDDVVNYSGVYSSDENKVDLRLLRYAMFDDDYFTTALPWLQRGDVSTLETDLTISNIEATTTIGVPASGYLPLYANGTIGTPLQAVSGTLHQGSSSSTYSGNFGVSYTSIKNSLTPTTTLSGDVTGNLSLTANQLRNLIALSVWQERNARTDGSYNKMIYQHWTANPKSEEHRPVYIGGTVDYLNFSSIVQNSQSTSDSPLGSTAGLGTSSGEGSVCNSYVCPDHGYIMGVMIIKPETVYQQGVEKLFTEFAFEDFPQPEFEGLSPQPILNQELYLSNSSSASDNEDLFAYQERYTYLKVRQNVNRGLMQCKPDKDILFSAYTQARWFSSKPSFSYQFLCMSPENIRRDWLAYPVYPAFRCQFLSNVFVTRSLAYNAEPETFGF